MNDIGRPGSVESRQGSAPLPWGRKNERKKKREKKKKKTKEKAPSTKVSVPWSSNLGPPIPTKDYRTLTTKLAYDHRYCVDNSINTTELNNI